MKIIKRKNKHETLSNYTGLLWQLKKRLRDQWLSEHDLRALQNVKLQQLICHTYENVPYYRNIFKQESITPKDILTVDDLPKIPVSTKLDIRELTSGEITSRHANLSNCHTQTTSGSSGIPLEIYWDIPFSNIVEPLTSAKSSYVLIAFLIILPFMILLNSLQMQVLTHKQGLSLSVSQISEINLITSFYNLFLAGYLSGGVIRWYKFSKVDGKPVEALSAIVFNRLFNILLIIVLGIAFWMLDSKARSNYSIGIILIVLLSVFLLCYVIAFNKNINAFLIDYLNNKKRIPEFIRNKIVKTLRATYEFHDLSLKNLLYIFGLL